MKIYLSIFLTFFLYSFAIAQCQCPNCSGSGWVDKEPVSCVKCGGSGVESCMRCLGKGTELCNQCFNSGVVNVKCGICNGSGEVDDLTCTVCSGSGKVSEVCISCDGMGRWNCGRCGGSGQETCSLCDGSGSKVWKEPCGQCRQTGQIDCGG